MIDDPDFQNSTLRLLVFQALKQYSIEAMLPMLSDKDPIVRTAAARELQVRSGNEVFDAASALAIGARYETREIAAFLLGQLGTPHVPYRQQSIPLLKALLKDDYYEVRASAVAALGHLKAEEARSEIIELASDSEPDVRECVAFALGCMKADKRALETLRQLSLEENKDVREWAEFSLEAHGQPLSKWLDNGNRDLG